MVPANPSRTVVIGIDSVDLLLLQRWCGQGRLPFFGSMLANASLVRLSTVSRVLQGAIWPSLLSGRSPGEHGSYFNTQLTSGSYNLDLVEADHSELNPYYLELDAQGVRCAIVDVPNERPREQFKGLQVIDWLTEFKYWKFAARNGADTADIENRFGTLYKSGGYGPTLQTPDGYRELRRRMEKSIAIKGAFAKELLTRADLDHVFVVFAETHKAGHHLWKYMDETHPDHEAAEPFLRDGLLAVYQALDRQLAELTSLLRPGDNLVLFADHGMQANYRGDHFVVPILQKLGLCAPDQIPVLESSRNGSTTAPVAASAALDTKPGAAARMKELFKRVAPRFLTSYLRRKFGPAGRIDWQRTRVILLPTDRNTYLRINLRGREPDGIVSPGREYDELLMLLETEFRALVNVETGKPAVEEVFRPHSLYPGPRVNDLPDLVVLWHAAAPLNSVESPRLGRLNLRISEDRSGNHREEGFLLARGPAIRPHTRSLQANIMQVPATLLALHGVEVPPRFEMGPIADLLATDRAPAITHPDPAPPPGRLAPRHPATAAPRP